jgi:preprotein translocase subunit YajC
MPENLQMFLPLIAMFAIFYFLLIRPQQKQRRERQSLLQSLKKGDRVITVSGIYGMIKEINDNVITLRIADNVNVKMVREGVNSVVTDEE